ncbi:MAG: DUF3368 domain-containing protein [Porphyromonadaceae bacterium]|jgi:predicted nucleic acid-binding protein|nr:DUF3368 domain-containing protein [Porphyromonadaceae bacterium]
MRRIVIADTSTLIIFQKIDEFDILKKMYDEVAVTKEIVDEFGEALPEWFLIEEVSNKTYQTLLETQVDLGEASAIALAIEKKNSLLILDDLKARKLAQKLNLEITGTLGILLKAKHLNIISNVKSMIDKLIETDFRISDNIIQEVLKISGETE